MKILLDLQGIQSGSADRGIGRYSIALAKAMLRQAGSHDISIMLNHAFGESIDSIVQDFSSLIERDKILLWQSLMPVAENNPENKWRIRSAELLREQFIQSISPDILHISSLFEGMHDDAVSSIAQFDTATPVSVTHYDLIPYLNPEHYNLNKASRNWYFKKINSLKQADLLLAISEASRKELITHLEIPEDKLVTISTDADAIFSIKDLSEQQKNKIFHQYAITKKFIMYTGAISQDEPHKNVSALIRAFALLPQDIQHDYQLLMVGGTSNANKNTLTKQARRLGLKADTLIFTDYVSDNELVSLYNLCHLFIFPSLHEGFGLPILEAMRCGAPVITSNCSSMPEVIGLEQALFDPTSDQSIADKIHQALSDKSFYNVLLQHSEKQCKTFSWDKTAKLALNAFETLHQQLATKPPGKLPQQLQQRNNGITSLVSAIKTIDGSPSEQDLARTALAIAENQLPLYSHQLFIDITHLVQTTVQTGIQRVVNNIINEITQSSPDEYRIQTVYRHKGQYLYAPNDEKAQHNNTPIEVSPSDIFLGLDLDYNVDEQASQLLNHHRQRGMKLYFVVYDLLPIVYPDLFPIGTDTFFKHWLHKIASIADGLICISKTVADELLVYLKAHPPERSLPLNIGFFHLGANIVDNQFNNTEKNTASDSLFKQNYTTFLMVGTIEPRKAHAQILDAMEQLWQNGHPIRLVILGKEGWNVNSLVQRLEKHSQKNKLLFWYENADDEFLKQLYLQASALIMASKGEGFGLPLIEAAQHQLPIICRDIPVFREVAGEHAFYFSADGTNSIAEQLLEWEALFNTSSHPDSSQLSYIDWNESKQQLLDVVIEQNWYQTYKSEGQG